MSGHLADATIWALTHPGHVMGITFGVTLAGCVGMILARRWEQS